jgi:hypothetical protein
VVFARYIVIGMGFLVMIFNYALRVNINMTLVAMVKTRPPKNDTIYSGECGHHEIDDWGGIEPDQVRHVYIDFLVSANWVTT